jgi:hypothetical protein
MKIYGFGSYFSSDKSYRDIDILIIHESGAYESCRQAIELKKNILREIEGAHVSILSKSAEEHFDFIYTSRAVFLGIVDENDFLPHLNKIISKVAAFRKT